MTRARITSGWLAKCLMCSVFALIVGCVSVDAPPQGVLIEGIAIVDDGVTALEGYDFEVIKTPETESQKVVLRRAIDGSISGTFDCGCHFDADPGGCKVRVIETTLKCLPTVCQNCVLVVDIPGLRPARLMLLALPCSKPLRVG